MYLAREIRSAEAHSVLVFSSSSGIDRDTVFMPNHDINSPEPRAVCPLDRRQPPALRPFPVELTLT